MENIELQLLFVVMGDSTVVMKVEKGRVCDPDIETVQRIYNPLDTRPTIWNQADEGDVRIFSKPFFEVRAAIDGLEEKPPVPRVEKNVNGGYSLFLSRQRVEIDTVDWTALYTLFGKPLPIYEPKKGEWKKLLPCILNDIYHKDGGTISDASEFHAGAEGVEIWRYTRRKA